MAWHGVVCTELDEVGAVVGWGRHLGGMRQNGACVIGCSDNHGGLVQLHQEEECCHCQPLPQPKRKSSAVGNVRGGLGAGSRCGMRH